MKNISVKNLESDRVEQKPGLGIKIFAWLSALLLICGHTFRIMHWPFAAPLIILGSILFVLFYLPLWFMQVMKDKNDRFIKTIQFLTLFLYGVTTLWKSMHWPGAGFFFKIQFFYGLGFLLPYSLYLLVRTGKRSLDKFHILIILILIIGSSTSALLRSVSTNVVNTFAASGASIERSIERSENRNRRLYEAFDKLVDKNSPYYQKAQSLKELSDSMANYVLHTRSKIISLIDGYPERVADSLSIRDIMDKVNVDAVNKVLVGNDVELNTGKYSGHELRTKVLSYCDTIIELIDSQNKEFIKAGMNFDLEDNITDHEGNHVDWASGTFYETPAVTALTILLGIENDIRNAETQVLSDLLNSATRTAGGEVAAKLSDLGEKLEKEQKEKQIMLLQKDRELNDLRMSAKNAELAERDQTIAFFVLGLVICCVLLFFIIRSNFIRKKINKELAEQKKIIEEQKHEVEEKQREIIDSIKYAKRIQGALITNEKYVTKEINRLKKY